MLRLTWGEGCADTDACANTDVWANTSRVNVVASRHKHRLILPYLFTVVILTYLIIRCSFTFVKE